MHSTDAHPQPYGVWHTFLQPRCLSSRNSNRQSLAVPHRFAIHPSHRDPLLYSHVFQHLRVLFQWVSHSYGLQYCLPFCKHDTVADLHSVCNKDNNGSPHLVLIKNAYKIRAAPLQFHKVGLPIMVLPRDFLNVPDTLWLTFCNGVYLSVPFLVPKSNFITDIFGGSPDCHSLLDALPVPVYRHRHSFSDAISNKLLNSFLSYVYRYYVANR